MKVIAHIALKLNFNNGILNYYIENTDDPDSLVGKRVYVNVRNKKMLGLIVGISNRDDQNYKIHPIEHIIDQRPIVKKKQLELMRFCAKYYLNNFGLVAHLAVPRDTKRAKVKNVEKETNSQAFKLTSPQQRIADEILKENEGAYLLEGITGSGKTLIYFEVAKEVLKKNKSVLFVVPEISLTPQLIGRVENALGFRALVIHSNITPAKKRDTYFALTNNTPKVLIGARSSIFAPLHNLGLIIIDEEHDASLKQDESPRYHARDLALWRGQNEKAIVILGSATPSLESRQNIIKNRLVHFYLGERFSKHKSLPQIEIIDLKKRHNQVETRRQDESKSLGQKLCILSRPLIDAIDETINKNLQVILFLNQRGYARFGICSACGEIVQCPSCSVSLTYYKTKNIVACHQCQHVKMAPKTCDNCLKNAIYYLGIGTERLQAEVQVQFPNAKILRLDRDVVQSQKRLVKTLDDMHNKKADILIGTQMVTKGHDFKHVALVGVVLADNALSLPDFRAGEKTFQLLMQVSGRAGRGEYEGKTLIQTFNKDHPAIKHVVDHNVKEFSEFELHLRKRLMQPPFTKAALVRIEHKSLHIAQQLIQEAAVLLKKESNITLYGPAPSPIERINNRYRFQCLVTSGLFKDLHIGLNNLNQNDLFNRAIHQNKARFIIDIDPQNMS